MVSDGAVDLGGSVLEFDSLIANTSLIKSWGEAFSADGDFLIYGCDLAASADGQGLVNALGRLTGADVAASDDLTGSAALGGDWELEYRTGLVETEVAVSQEARENWSNVMVTTYTVTTTAATGAGSLDEAINLANAAPNSGGPDRIDFNIGGGGAQTIAVAAAGLPMITDPVILDATTQPGYSGTPLITLDGSATADNSGINGLVLRTNDSTIKGFIVHSFADEGIEIDGSTGFGDNNIIQNNWVGIDSLSVARGNAEHGIMISESATGNQIGGSGLNEGNVVAGNGFDRGTSGDRFSGIVIENNSDNNIVEGNLVGVLPDGVTVAANGDQGILIQKSSDGNRIGGTAAGAGNVISGNTADGIHIDGTTDATFTTAVTGTIIQGNRIGTNQAGTAAVGNGDEGISIQNNVTNTTIGGNTARSPQHHLRQRRRRHADPGRHRHDHDSGQLHRHGRHRHARPRQWQDQRLR